MKKLISLFLVAAMLMTAAVCFADEAKPYDGQTITFWMQKYGSSPETQAAAIEKLAADFKAQTDINVEYSLVDWSQAFTKYTLAMSGGECPDVSDIFMIYSFAAIGGEEYGPIAIDDIVEEMGGEGKFFDFAKPECYVNGHWVGLPWRGDTRIACYNTEMFKEAGIESFPTTTEELIEVAKKLTTYDANGNVDRAGMVFYQSANDLRQSFRVILTQFGGRFMKDDFSEYTIDTPEMREALKFMQDCLYTYKVMPTTILDPTFSSNDAFMAGKAAMIIGVPHDFMDSCKNNAPQIAEVTLGAINPSKTGEGASSIAFAAPIVVWKQAEKNGVEGAAKEWLKFLFQEENQITLCKGCGTVSVWGDVLKNEYFSSQWFQTVLAQNDRAVPGDMPVVEWSQVDSNTDGPVNNMILAVMAGADIETEIAKCVEGINEIVSNIAE